MKTVLAIDNSGRELFLALKLSTGEIVESVCSVQSGGVSGGDQILISSFDRIFKQCAIKVSDLGFLVFGSGPGSFTGLRISLAFLKGLSFALKIPIISVPSLRAYAWWEMQDQSISEVLVMLPLGKDDIALAGYAGCSVKEVRPLAMVKRSDFRHEFFRNSSAILLGYDALNAAEPFTPRAPQSVGRALIELAELQSEYSLSKLSMLEPQYFRAVSARTIEQRLASKTL